MHSVLTGRMLLNLRYYGKYTSQGDGPTMMSTVSPQSHMGDIMFRHTMTIPELE